MATRFVKHAYYKLCHNFMNSVGSKYTHRQKLSNSKLVLNIKKMFHTKILEIQVLLSSFDFIRIEYQCN